MTMLTFRDVSNFSSVNTAVNALSVLAGKESRQQVLKIESDPGGELPYEEYTGVCHELGSYFQEKIPKRVCQFFTKIPERATISVRNSR